MIKKKDYNYQELIDCGKGKLFGKGNAKLPLPPLLMFDRITEINENKGSFKKGFVKAELDIKPDDLNFSIKMLLLLIFYCLIYNNFKQFVYYNCVT